MLACCGRPIQAPAAQGRARIDARRPADHPRPAAGRTRAMMAHTPRVLAVLGMHRSGTSLLARLLTELGARGPNDPLAAHPDNPDGYLESRRVLALDKKLLERAGLSWYDDAPLPAGYLASRRARGLRRVAQRILREELSPGGLFVLKDPRLSRLVPFWAEALEAVGAETHWLLMLRHPLEVARSLEARMQWADVRSAAVTAPGQALLLWLRYTLEAERDTCSCSRTLIAFEDLLADWRAVVRRVHVAAPWLEEAGPSIAPRIDALVSPDRPRSRPEADERLRAASRGVCELHELLRTAIRTGAPLPRARLEAELVALDEAWQAWRHCRGRGEVLRRDDPWGPRELEWTHERAARCLGLGAGRLPRRVLFFSGVPDSRGHVYRVENHAAALRTLGVEARVLPRPDPDEVRLGDVAILFRVPWDTTLEAFVGACRRRAVPVGFDIDDLVFDPELLTPQSFALLRGASATEHGRWRGLAVDLRATLLACDFTVLTTEELAQHVRRMSKPAFVLPNALGSAALRRYARARLRRRMRSSTDSVCLGYASGTPTHQGDFAAVAPALARVLAERPQARLCILGELDLTDLDALAAHRERIELLPRVPYSGVPRAMRDFDLALAPLERESPFCRCKSEIKYVEAGALGLPIVATDTPPFRAAIEDGLNGRLAPDGDAWHAALLDLIDRPLERLRMGERARAHILGLRGPQATQRDARWLHARVLAEIAR